MIKKYLGQASGLLYPLEGIYRDDVILFGNLGRLLVFAQVTSPVLIRSNAKIAECVVASNIGLEGLDLQDPRTSSCALVGQISAIIFIVPDIEVIATWLTLHPQEIERVEIDIYVKCSAFLCCPLLYPLKKSL